MTKTQQLASIAGLLAGGLALNASAAIQYTPWQAQDTGLQGTTGAVTTLTFDQYNAADYGGSALHNVELMLDGVGYVTYQYLDASNADNTFTFIADITITVDDPTSADDLIVTIPEVTDIERTVGPLGTYTAPGYGPPQDFDSALQATDSAAATYVGATLTPALVALFAGTGTVDLDTSATIANLTVSSGDNDTFLRSRYSGTVSVRYSYQPAETPEPSTMLLFGAGLAGAGALARRRNKRA
jgi:hypothetical protein